MSAAGLPIPEDVVSKVTLQLFGTEGVETDWRREAVEMALAEVSHDLLAAWVIPTGTCTSKSRFDGIPCDLTAGHPAWRRGARGGSTAAWDDGIPA